MLGMVCIAVEGIAIGKYGDEACVKGPFQMQNVGADIETDNIANHGWQSGQALAMLVALPIGNLGLIFPADYMYQHF